MNYPPVSKSRIKYLQSLKLKKYRQKYQSFLAEGRKVTLEIINDNLLTVKGIYAIDSWLSQHEHLLSDRQWDVWEVDDKSLKQISAFNTPDQVLIECTMCESVNMELLLEQPGWILYLHGIMDPGNLGSIIRTSDWFGCKAILLKPGSVDLYNPKTIHAAMGSFGRIPVDYLAPEEVHQYLPNHQWFLADMDGSPPYDCSPESEFNILIIGSESHGLSGFDGITAAKKVTIPKSLNSNAESLNAAVAAGILMSHLMS